jgi:hypothetical protein
MKHPIGTFLCIALFACGGDDELETSTLLGAECQISADCDDQCLGPSNDYPDGLCTLGCDVNADCPLESDCIDKEGGVCLFVCAVDEDCAFLGPEWICRDENLREDQNTQSGVCLGN